MHKSDSLDVQEIVQVMLPERLHSGILLRRIRLDGAPFLATNVPLLRHASHTGFDFGNDGPGATDLALACVQYILSSMDYVGPVQKLWDGSRVYRLALDLQTPFRVHFIEPAQGDEVRIGWSRALSWVRSALLAKMQAERLTPASLVDEWRRSVSALPNPLPNADLDLAELSRRLNGELVQMAGKSSVLAQFLGMIA